MAACFGRLEGLQPRVKEIEVKILLKYFRVGFKIVSKWEIKI